MPGLGESSGALGTFTSNPPRAEGGTHLDRFRAFEWIATVQPIEIITDADRPKLDAPFSREEEKELPILLENNFGFVDRRWNMARAYKNRVYVAPFAAGPTAPLAEAATQDARPSSERGRFPEYPESDLYGNDITGGGTINFDPYSLEWAAGRPKSPGQMENTDGIHRGSIRIDNDPATNLPVHARLHFHDEMRSFVRLKPSDGAPWIRVSEFSYIHFHDAVRLVAGSSDVFELDPLVGDANGGMQPGPDGEYDGTSQHR